MILAEKIIKLRKQLGWSQEELAEKMDISRQSVSKWESANSIPDLNKILKLAEIFEVSTDFLLKDEYDAADSTENQSKTNSADLISLEQALHYTQSKIEAAALTLKGVVLCICSVVPLFFFMAMSDVNRMNMTDDIAAALGVISIVLMVSLAISFFIKTNQYHAEIDAVENDGFDLAYGVHSVFSEKAEKYKATYNRKLSIGIFMFIFSFVPLMTANIIFENFESTKMMLIVLLFMVSGGIAIILPASAKHDAFNTILEDGDVNNESSKRAKRAEKLAAFYWPLLAAIFLGWSLWTMDWGTTWIIWPVGAVLFGALVGLMELLSKDDE